MIDVAINIDASFVPYSHVMLYSLEESNAQESFTIHVINIGLDDNHKNEFITLHPKMTFQFYTVDRNMVESLPMRRNDYVSPATYLRIFLPDLIPASINKILFLDCDTLILDNIRNFWDINLENRMIAAVEERPPYDTQKPETLNYSIDSSYFNAGVALINLKAMRECNFSQKASLFIEEHRDLIRHHDQDIMNALTAGQNLFVSCRWNLLDFFTFKKPEIQSRRIDDLQSALAHPAIVHFSNKRKPWHHNCDNPFRDLYLTKTTQYGVNIGPSWKLKTKKVLRNLLYAVILKRSKYLKPHNVPYLATLLCTTR